MGKFKIIEADLGAGYVGVEFDLPDGGTASANFHIESVVASHDATELELVNGISQLVKQRLAQLFPPPHPQPQALSGMIGKDYEVMP